MVDEMKANLKDTRVGQAAAITVFDGFVAANTKENTALTEAIGTKTKVCVGEIAVKFAEQGNDLHETKPDLEESKKFFGGLQVNDERKKKRRFAERRFAEVSLPMVIPSRPDLMAAAMKAMKK